MKLRKRPITKKQDLKLVFLTEEKCFTTSHVVAEMFEKRHDHVLRDTRMLIDQLKSVKGHLPKIGECFRINELANGKSEPYYEMDRDAFSLLVMGFTGEKALKWKLKFLEAFNAMEAKLKEVEEIDQKIKALTALPLTYLEFEQLSLNERKVQQSQFHEIMSHFGLSERGCKLAHIRIRMCAKVNQIVNGISSHQFRQLTGINRGLSRDWMPLINQYALYRVEFDLLRICRLRDFQLTLEELETLYVGIAERTKEYVEYIESVELHTVFTDAMSSVQVNNALNDGYVISPYEWAQTKLDQLSTSPLKF